MRVQWPKIHTITHHSVEYGLDRCCESSRMDGFGSNWHLQLMTFEGGASDLGCWRYLFMCVILGISWVNAFQDRGILLTVLLSKLGLFFVRSKLNSAPGTDYTQINMKNFSAIGEFETKSPQV